MEILRGKSYIRKNAQNSDIFIIKNISHDFITFENSAQIKIATLQSDFEEYNPMNENRFITSVSENLMENSNELNPDTFFTTPTNGEYVKTEESKVNQSVNLDLNPVDFIKQKQRENAITNKNVDVTQIPTPVQPIIQQQNNNNNVSTQHNNEIINQPIIENNHRPQEIRLPEWDMFDRMKKSIDVELLIPVKIKLPKAATIESMNDTFETSLTAYLAKEFIKNNIINGKSFQIQMQAAIEKWVETELDKTPVSKKKNKKEKITDKEIIEIPKKTEETIMSIDAVGDLLRGKKNTSKSNWDGNVTKLYIISSQEQLDAVNDMILKLKNSNTNTNDNLVLLDRLEDMFLNYKSLNNIK